MKILYAILVTIIIVSIVFVLFQFKPQPQINTKVEISFDKELLDLDPSPLNIPVVGKFKLYNKSKNEIQISEAVPDCHCTSIDYPKQAIPPNDSVEIKIVYDGKKMGPFQSSAVVKFKGSHIEDLLILRGAIK
ncbi:DUF1573 domain-containing protein [Sphingobacterium faecium]|uniref:DUF1573 domain-containing protein n=1 Tax=Sphingobacterium faecium TaxID=34087 RepID=UPI003DA2BE9F